MGDPVSIIEILNHVAISYIGYAAQSTPILAHDLMWEDTPRCKFRVNMLLGLMTGLVRVTRVDYSFRSIEEGSLIVLHYQGWRLCTSLVRWAPHIELNYVFATTGEARHVRLLNPRSANHVLATAGAREGWSWCDGSASLVETCSEASFIRFSSCRAHVLKSDARSRHEVQSIFRTWSLAKRYHEDCSHGQIQRSVRRIRGYKSPEAQVAWLHGGRRTCCARLLRHDLQSHPTICSLCRQMSDFSLALSTSRKSFGWGLRWEPSTSWVAGGYCPGGLLQWLSDWDLLI